MTGFLLGHPRSAFSPLHRLRIHGRGAHLLLLPSHSSSSTFKRHIGSQALLAVPPSEPSSSPEEAAEFLRRGRTFVEPHQMARNKRMKELVRQGKPLEAFKEFQEMKRCGVIPNVFCCNTVFNALATMERPREAMAFFGSMIISEVELNASSFNILVKTYCRLDELDLACTAAIMMKQQGHRPDSNTFSAIIVGLCRHGRMDEARGVLDSMPKEGCRPTVHTYTPLVQRYCWEGMIEDARSTMSDMENEGCHANVVTYNILVDGLCQKGLFDEVRDILEQSDTKGWRPNEITYNVYVSGLCKWGRSKEALEIMLERGGQCTTSHSINILLNCLCRESMFSDAAWLLTRNIAQECSVGVVGYNTLMSRLCDIGWKSSVLVLLSDMLKKGVSPNVTTFNIVINNFCKSRNLRDAWLVLYGGAFVANVATYNTLIYWFLREGNMEKVWFMLPRMAAQKIASDIITCEILIIGLCRCWNFPKVMNYFLKSLETLGHNDSRISTICSLVNNRDFDQLQNILNELRK